MLSVLIPIYNYDVADLAATLSDQAVDLGIAFELVLVDDASHESFRQRNRLLSSLTGVKYSEEPENLGRSRIRNKLARMARFENLLFMDCDSAVIDPDYLKNYLETIGQAAVVYGGTLYTSNLLNPEDQRMLHWLHGVKREQSMASSRNQFPNRSFKTNNFFIRKEVFSQLSFSENIKGYGHEDTLFGFELEQHHFRVLHIDNPVVHLGLETNEEFLRKTREGITNLTRIMSINGNEKRLIRDITLLAYYHKIRNLRLDGVLKTIYSRYESRLRKNLLSSHPNLMLFDLYKLGYLCSIRATR